MRILTFGEFLYDCFEEEKVPGGAPFNLAVHLSRLGADVDFCTSVGKDADGEAALALMKQEGIGTEFCNRSELPTGRCFVKLKNGLPTYHLQYPAAWDKILPPETVGHYDAVCFGTQAQRSDVSCRSLHHLLDHVSAGEIYVDLNLRGRQQNPEALEYALSKATILKLSREEAPQLTSVNLAYADDRREEFFHVVAASYPNLHHILLTLDKEGALFYDCKTGETTAGPTPNGAPVSAVGAGDSFSAAFLVSYLSGAEISDCLKKGTLLADFVVTHTGAIPPYTEELKAALEL